MPIEKPFLCRVKIYRKAAADKQKEIRHQGLGSFDS